MILSRLVSSGKQSGLLLNNCSRLVNGNLFVKAAFSTSNRNYYKSSFFQTQQDQAQKEPNATAEQSATKETPAQTTEQNASEASKCKVIVVTSGKGGVGKTTTAASVGYGLASQGFKTCVIDYDVGLRNLDIHLVSLGS
jgi:septum site-determining protein MinD